MIKRIDDFFGLKLRFNWSVLILIALASLSISNVVSNKYIDVDTRSFESLSIGFLFSIAMILSIVAHEMAHVTIGRKFGVNFYGITIFMFGGAAKMENYPPTAKSEFWMALAGPAFSFILGAALLASAMFIDSIVFENKSSLPYNEWVWLVAGTGALNITLCVFNLLPMFPLDGGRVLRSSIWWIRGNLIEATKIASLVGKFGGGVFIACGLQMMLGYNIPFLGIGIVSGIWICFIGSLIVMMAQKEYDIVVAMFQDD